MKTPYDIIKTVVITEKSAKMADKMNKFVFIVAPSANKVEIKQAVEALYPEVKVEAVNISNRMGKMKRMRSAKYGRRSDTKRAIVTLKEGTIQVV